MASPVEEKTEVANLHKNNSNSDSKIINSLEGFAINDSSAFSRIRDSLKQTGDMFLFGKPTPDLLTIFLKIYHENYIRNMCFNKSDYVKTGILPDLDKSNHVQFMCGMIQMKDKHIYTTISEAPKFRDRVEDEKFNIKEEALIDILHACNIKTEFPEEGENRNTFQAIVDVKAENAKHESRWRLYDDKGPRAGVLDPSKISEYNNHLLVKSPESSTVGSKSGINYDDALWKTPFTVNIINSYKYLKKRINTGMSFAPFKKYDSKTQRIECNNGSTCTESKLFSYVYNDLGGTWDDIDGFIVFWVGNKLPPDHIIKNYCYDDTDPKLNTMVDELLRINDFSSLSGASGGGGGGYYTPEKIKKIMKLAGRAIAMACPGCYSNNSNYRSKKGMDTLWDQRGCYIGLNSRTRRRTRTSSKAAFNALHDARQRMYHGRGSGKPAYSGRRITIRRK
jgi:hypothetical protein